jgi:hypothetical protein
MKNITHSSILFFALTLHTFNFGMNKNNSIALTDLNSTVLGTVMLGDLVSGSKGSWVRTAGTILGVGCAVALDETITEKSQKSCTDFQRLAVAGVVGFHLSRAVSYIIQGNEEQNSNNELDKLQRKITALEEENKTLRSAAQMVYKQNQSTTVAQVIPQQNR